MTSGAGGSIERGYLPVNIVLPSDSVVCRLHDSVASVALILRRERGTDVLVADETLRTRSLSLGLVMYAERFVMEIRFHVDRMVRRNVAGGHRIRVACGAVRHPERGGNRPCCIVALDAIQHLR